MSSLSPYALTALIGAAIIVVLLLLPRLLGRRSRSKGGWSVLVMGAAGAGKTTLFLRLRDGKLRNTVTSMQPNEGKVEVGDKKRVTVIDLPGHARLEATYFEREVVNAKGIVLVVDSVNFNATKEEFARHMYRLLTSPVVRGRGVPILVACAKSDSSKAHTTEFIRKRTEKMINELYQADVGDSMRGDDNAQEHHILSAAGGDFKFEDLAVKRRFHRPVKVQFEHVSSVKGDGIDKVVEFIAAC